MTETLPDSAVAERSARLGAGDPAWLRDLRAAELGRWTASALPDRVAHLWRYTAPSSLLPQARAADAADGGFGDIPSDFADATFDRASAFAVARDGVLLRSVVDPMLSDLGLVVEDLRAAAAGRRALVEPRLTALGATCDGAGAPFEHLSAALFAGGSFVHVPRGVHLDRPVRIAHRVGGHGVRAARSVIVAEPGSFSTVVVELSSAAPDDATLVHEAVEVFVGPGAKLRLVLVQTLGRKAVHAPIVRARVDRDATFESVSLALGGAIVKSLQTADLAAPGAHTKVLGIVFADGRQHFDHHTFQDHTAPHTTSELDYRTVVGDRARSAYTGRLRITSSATGASAQQRNHNLLLSEHARADTIPELEILTNEVLCSHAAAVGPIDDDQIHYCASRGLDPEEARRVVVLGFLEPTIAQVPGEPLVRRVREALDTRLSGARR